MDEQPEALRIADALELPIQESAWYRSPAAAELRRLHDSVQTMNSTIKDMDVLNTELLEALKELVQVSAHLDACHATVEQARAAIAKAEGETK